MADLSQEIAAYEAMQPDLEAKYLGRWVLVHDLKVIGTYATFDEAATFAVNEFGRGPYLIRQIGAPIMTLPASVVYYPIHAHS
jgi:hypothetical protein